MGGGDYCCVGSCGNSRRRPESQKVQSHVLTLRWRCLPKDPAKRWQWVEQIRSGRRDFNPTENTTETKVCSNHFPDGEPTTSNPTPVLFMSPSEVQLPAPKKGRTIQKHHSPPQPLPVLQTPHSESKQTVHHSFLLCTASLQLSKDADVKFYTGFSLSVFLTNYFPRPKRCNAGEAQNKQIKKLHQQQYLPILLMHMVGLALHKSWGSNKNYYLSWWDCVLDLRVYGAWSGT